MRNRVLTKAECLVNSMMLRYLVVIVENVRLGRTRSTAMIEVGDKNVPVE